MEFKIFIVRRLALSILAIFGIITFSFFLIHIVPGDPTDLILGEEASSIDQEQLRKQMGLDKPITTQYINYLTGVFTFDLGQSVYDKKSVTYHLSKAFVPTIKLSLVVLFFSLLIGVSLAVLTALYKDSLFDHICSMINVFSFSLPVFFVAPMLIWLLSIYWPLFPLSEMQGWKNYVLPAASLILPLSAALTQMGKASILEIINQDYIQTARAKGLSQLHVYFKHALKPALIPMITIFSLQTAALLTGTIIVETIFDWPGIGLLLFQSIERRDYPVIQACVLLIAVVYLLVNILADIVYSLVHPQMR